jgi:hypothetical protein
MRHDKFCEHVVAPLSAPETQLEAKERISCSLSEQRDSGRRQKYVKDVKIYEFLSGSLITTQFLVHYTSKNDSLYSAE